MCLVFVLSKNLSPPARPFLLDQSRAYQIWALKLD